LKELDLPGVKPVSLTDFERENKELSDIKNSRTKIEYYFTCSPFWPAYVFKKDESVDLLTYVDADLFFFSDVTPIFKELGNNSILIIEHRFPKWRTGMDKFGKYNVSILCFRRDDIGFRCLKWWQERCIEWCHDRVEDGKFADQKYLDDWCERFGRVTVLRHKGAGLAPWNVMNYELSEWHGEVFIDDIPLIFFHFHRLEEIKQGVYATGLEMYNAHKNGVLRKHIYLPYVTELDRISAYLNEKAAHRDEDIRSKTIRSWDKDWKMDAGAIKWMIQYMMGRLFGWFVSVKRGGKPFDIIEDEMTFADNLPGKSSEKEHRKILKVGYRFKIRSEYNMDVISKHDTRYPRMSVIMPTYNQGAFIERAILSILNQNYPNLEFIIIDGGSTDDTINIIKKYERYISYWQSKPDNGQADAINQGLAKATGVYVSWLNSDDFYLSGVLKNVAGFFEKSGADIVHANEYVVDTKDMIIGENRGLPFPEMMGLAFFIYGGYWTFQTTMFWKKELHDKYGFLDTKYNFALDLELFSRFAVNGAKFRYMNQHVAGFRYHAFSKNCTLQEVRARERKIIMMEYGKYIPRIFRNKFLMGKLSELYFLRHFFIGNADFELSEIAKKTGLIKRHPIIPYK